MAGILYADTHVAEPPQMWDYLDPEWRPRRPVVVIVPDDTQYGLRPHVAHRRYYFPQGGPGRQHPGHTHDSE